MSNLHLRSFNGCLQDQSGNIYYYYADTKTISTTQVLLNFKTFCCNLKIKNFRFLDNSF